MSRFLFSAAPLVALLLAIVATSPFGMMMMVHALDCDQYTSCYDCSAEKTSTGGGGCGWCESTKKCSFGNSAGPFTGTCSSSDWIWEQKSCPGPPPTPAPIPATPTPPTPVPMPPLEPPTITNATASWFTPYGNNQNTQYVNTSIGTADPYLRWNNTLFDGQHHYIPQSSGGVGMSGLTVEDGKIFIQMYYTNLNDFPFLTTVWVKVIDQATGALLGRTPNVTSTKLTGQGNQWYDAAERKLYVISGSQVLCFQFEKNSFAPPRTINVNGNGAAGDGDDDEFEDEENDVTNPRWAVLGNSSSNHSNTNSSVVGKIIWAVNISEAVCSMYLPGQKEIHYLYAGNVGESGNKRKTWWRWGVVNTTSGTQKYLSDKLRDVEYDYYNGGSAKCSLLEYKDNVLVGLVTNYDSVDNKTMALVGFSRVYTTVVWTQPLNVSQIDPAFPGSQPYFEFGQLLAFPDSDRLMLPFHWSTFFPSGNGGGTTSLHSGIYFIAYSLHSKASGGVQNPNFLWLKHCEALNVSQGPAGSPGRIAVDSDKKIMWLPIPVGRTYNNDDKNTKQQAAAMLDYVDQEGAFTQWNALTAERIPNAPIYRGCSPHVKKLIVTKDFVFGYGGPRDQYNSGGQFCMWERESGYLLPNLEDRINTEKGKMTPNSGSLPLGRGSEGMKNLAFSGGWAYFTITEDPNTPMLYSIQLNAAPGVVTPPPPSTPNPPTPLPPSPVPPTPSPPTPQPTTEAPPSTPQPSTLSTTTTTTTTSTPTHTVGPNHGKHGGGGNNGGGSHGSGSSSGGEGNNDDDQGNRKKALSPGALLGIFIGVAIMALLGVAALLLYQRKSGSSGRVNSLESTALNSNLKFSDRDAQ